MPANVEIRINGRKTTKLYKNSTAEVQSEIDRYVGNQVLRICEPYVPLESGALSQSGHYDEQSKDIVYDTPYARYQHGGKLMVDSETGSPYSPKGGHKVLTDRDLVYHNGAPQRGAHWFSRAMNNGGVKEIEKGMVKEFTHWWGRLFL